MVVGPEFGPIAGFCVALVQRRRELAVRSGIALAVGFPLAITGAYVATLIFKATGLTPADFDASEHQIANLISSPDFFSAFVAVCAGAAGHALALDREVRRADRRADLRHDDPRGRQHRRGRGLPGLATRGCGSIDQLAINLASILVAGTTVLAIQRAALRAPAPTAPARATTRRYRAQREPSDDQTSTFVRTFSTTASVNSLVVAWPPRSIVFVPVATVSSTPS